MNVRLLGDGDCEVVHEASGTVLRTSKSPAFGGSGRSFSSTDLLAAALATCIATDLERVASRAGIPPAAIRISTRRHLSQSPRRVEAIDVVIAFEQPVDEHTLVKLRRAADACLVQRSLAPDVECRISFEAA